MTDIEDIFNACETECKEDPLDPFKAANKKKHPGDELFDGIKNATKEDVPKNIFGLRKAR
jgi:hypothetical protein